MKQTMEHPLGVNLQRRMCQRLHCQQIIRVKSFSFLLQSTFGPQKKDLERIIEIGETAWIEEQLNYDSAYQTQMIQTAQI